MGHALGLFLAHAVHIARASAAHMRHTLRAGPGGGAVLGAAGAAGDIAMLWAILQVLTHLVPSGMSSACLVKPLLWANLQVMCLIGPVMLDTLQVLEA